MPFLFTYVCKMSMLINSSHLEILCFPPKAEVCTVIFTGNLFLYKDSLYLTHTQLYVFIYFMDLRSVMKKNKALHEF